MANVLYLVHRLPYPPNKGDKVRSYHLLRHLAGRHRLFLGTFCDDPGDLAHVDALRPLCAEVFVLPLEPRLARVRSLSALASGEAASLPFYRDSRMADWVRDTVLRNGIRTAVVFSSAMAQYVERLGDLRVLVDFVDVDSLKWTQYAQTRPWPLSWLYRREGAKLRVFEKATARRAYRSFFVTDTEADLFRSIAPESDARIDAVSNGVDTAYFSPAHEFASPYGAGGQVVVFTGAMDYWPNVDAVCWFASDVLPALRSRWPALRFYVVGMRPSPAVRALQGDAVVVTGTVGDVRPYLRHASVVVAPMRIARGIQNKVLEAMAMGRPVVASTECASGIAALPHSELGCAAGAAGFIDEVNLLLAEPGRAAAMGAAARVRVERDYSWDANLAAIGRHIIDDSGELAHAA